MMLSFYNVKVENKEGTSTISSKFSKLCEQIFPFVLLRGIWSDEFELKRITVKKYTK